MKRELKEQRLHDLVERYIAQLAGAGQPAHERSIELIAYSPESPIALALAARLADLAAAGVTVRAIFANVSVEPLLASWLAQAGWVRLARDKRLMEAHEQLVLGASRCWSGDAMRRGATKSDLFESLNEGSPEAARLGRQAFEKIAGFATVIRPRRVTASLNAYPQDRAAPAQAAVANVVPAPQAEAAFGAEARPLVTRH